MIHAENLTKCYSDLCAVDQVNFEIQKGEIVGLLGPNGAGKSTIMRMLTGYLRPTSGDITVKGSSIDEDPLEIKKLMGYLPESAPLYHDMLAYDYLNYVADIREIEKGNKGQRIGELADLCGINEVMHQPISELSKGYKQRVGLAHAMMNDPEILILDEPTSGLDPNQIREIRDIIRRIGKEKTVILSTHILSEAEATCDRAVIINQGRIIADSSMKSLKQSARGEAVIELCLKNASFGDAEAALKPINGIRRIENVDSQDGEIKVKIICGSSDDLREAVYERIKQTNWILLGLYQETQTLENIFRELTKEN